MPFNLGIGEILVVLVVALLVFGGRLPEVGRSLGRSIVEEGNVVAVTLIRHAKRSLLTAIAAAQDQPKLPGLTCRGRRVGVDDAGDLARRGGQHARPAPARFCP